MKKIIIFILLLSLESNFCYALDWKKLHEEADKKSIKETIFARKENHASTENLYVLGLVYLDKHMDTQAGTVFADLLIKDPNLTEAKWGMAEVLRRVHKLDQSEDILKGIIQKQPNFSPAYISLAYIHYTRMKFNDSIVLAYKVIRQGRDNVDLANYVRAYLILAGAKGMVAHYGGPLSKILNGTTVFSTLKKAEKLYPGYAGVLFGLGSFYLLAPTFVGGDINKAEEYLARAIRADTLFADAYVRLSQVFQLKSDNKKAQIYLDKALSIDPGNELAIDIKSGSCKFICVRK